MTVHSVPALIVGLVMASYWLRVVRLVVKTHRRTGESANFFPPEKLGLLLRILWIPAVGGWIAFPLIAALRGRLPWAMRPLWQNVPVAASASAASVVCLVLTWICWRRMGKSWRMGINPDERTQLVVSGPYAYVRHPIYALSTVLMLASVAACPSPALIACAVIHVMFLHWEARREERYLLRLHGEIYGRYRRSVGGFVPRSLTAFAGENS